MTVNLPFCVAHEVKVPCGFCGRGRPLHKLYATSTSRALGVAMCQECLIAADKLCRQPTPKETPNVPA